MDNKQKSYATLSERVTSGIYKTLNHPAGFAAITHVVYSGLSEHFINSVTSPEVALQSVVAGAALYAAKSMKSFHDRNLWVQDYRSRVYEGRKLEE